MKRDMDLVRSILIQVEDAGAECESGCLEFMGHSQAEVYYHIELMQQKGLIDATVKRDWGGSIIYATITGLTWDGQDFLDSMRDDRVWSRSRKAIKETVGSTTFDVIKKVCVEVAASMVLKSVGI